MYEKEKRILRKQLKVYLKKQENGKIVVGIPNGIDEEDANFLIGAKRSRLYILGNIECVTIVDEKCIVYASKNRLLKEKAYQSQFIEVCVRGGNTIKKFANLR